jgi:D-arabinose 1-dehydrogenase-like Zn-dependent alcohol dehydrogenase
MLSVGALQGIGGINEHENESSADQQTGGDWELIERDIPDPGAGQVRVKIEACGVCSSDALVKEGIWPGLKYPRVPGHEIAGRIDALGDNVTAWQKGQRVGIGWHGGHCLVCEQCRRGDFAMCVNRKVTGIDFDGGYAEFIIAPVTALAAIPDEPFMCAGVTVFNALRNSGARAGEVVAVEGIGGLGHLGIQYARQMGFKTVAIDRGNNKEPLARKLGAHHYIDATATDAVTELQKLDGARVILATAPNAQAISGLVDGLSPDGQTGRAGGAGRATDDQCVLFNPAAEFSRRRVCGHSEGFGRHHGIQCAERRASDDREVSA